MALNNWCNVHGTRLDGPEGTDGCSYCRRAADLDAERLAEENNPFAAHNRLIKVGKLLEQIDLQCAGLGVDPHKDGLIIAAAAEVWEEQLWGQLALNAATKPPSDKAKGIIIERYRERARAGERRAG